MPPEITALAPAVRDLELTARLAEDRARFQTALDVPEKVMTDLDAFFSLLLDWSGRMNLVGPSARTDFWSRHVLDSAQLLKVAPTARVWTDLGAGAGFPGLVLAIFLKGQTKATVRLVESMAKRCQFLTAVSLALDLPTEVHNARAESVNLSPGDVVTARAVAALPKLLQYAQPHLRGSTVGLFLKGREVEAEMAEARKNWSFEAELEPSLSGSDGHILKLQRLRRV